MKSITIFMPWVLLLVIGCANADIFNYDANYHIHLLDKAKPDECFKDIGESYVALSGNSCDADRQPKVNQAYVWGLAKTGTDFWLGTAANVNCLVEGAFLGSTNPYKNSSWVCEFGDSGFRAALAPSLPAVIGDWRPPQILRKPITGAAIVNAGSLMDNPGKTLLAATLGLRSAGTHKGVVLLAGPALSQQAINVFAFDDTTGAFIGSNSLPNYNNIRKWIVASGEMYTTVGKVDGTGAVLRWTGNKQSPFQFTEVGTLPSEGSELIEHQGRIYVATWPYLGGANPVYAGIFSTGNLPVSGGLEASNAALTQVWDVRQYEPDLVTAASYGGGALASFKGQLVWGTMHVPGVATALHMKAYKSYYDAITDSDEKATQQFIAFLATQRAIAIFTKKDGQAVPELLYGQANLPSFSSDKWQIVPNASGLNPQLGFSGFNNPFNNYTWTMALADGALFVGTMDWSYLLYTGLGVDFSTLLPADSSQLDEWLQQAVTANPGLQQFISNNQDVINAIRLALENPAKALTSPGNPLAAGGDLMRFDSLTMPAKAVSRNGLGNYLNYGFRTMIGEKDKLYIGTANPMNLMTSKDDKLPEGGWELLEIMRNMNGAAWSNDFLFIRQP